MVHPSQFMLPAVYMRGGTSKGEFFHLQDLPDAARLPGEVRDKLLMRAITGRDPWNKEIDREDAARFGASQTVIVAASARPCHDVDCLFGQVSIDKPAVDWSRGFGNLSAAVGLFAVKSGLIHRERIPRNGTAKVRIWQANIGKTIVAHVPVVDGRVQEARDLEMDDVICAAVEVQLEFVDPVSEKAGSGALFPTGNLVDELDVPGVGTLQATLINAGIPTVFLDVADSDYAGIALQDVINGDARALAMLEDIRAHGALRMGLAADVEQAARRQHTPKVAFVTPPIDYVSSSGKTVKAGDIDLLVRTLSMGQLHPAMAGTVAVAAATAAAIPGTLVNLAAGGRAPELLRIGHPSGIVRVRATPRQIDGEWIVTKAVMTRSAGVLSEGWVQVALEPA